MRENAFEGDQTYLKITSAATENKDESIPLIRQTIALL